MKYFVYIVECADGSFYTGITTDVKRRIIEHNSEEYGVGKGAKYTRARRPVSLVYFATFANRSLATQEEIRVKNLTRKQKEALIITQNSLE